MIDSTAVRAARGEIALEESGATFPSKLNAREWEAFEAAKEHGYAISSLQRSNLRNVWWTWCLDHRHPYIIIVRGQRRWVWIEMNFIPCPLDLSPEALQRIYHLLQLHSRPDSRLSCNGLHAFRTRLRLSEAEGIAREILEAVKADESG